LIVDNANLSDLEWNSNNSEIVSVDKGTINSKKVGEAIITVLVKGTDKKATIKIIVSEIKLFFKTKEVEIDAKKNKTIDLNEYLVIENADKKDIFWYFNQNEMISIKDGIVEAIGDGEVYVEASLKGTPIRDVILIKIKGIGITNFQISANIYANQLIINTTHKLNVYTYPVGDISTLKWKSSNNDVATVNNEGEVLGKALGNVTITAISPSGSTASVDLQIIPKEVTSITFTNNTSVPSKVIGGTTYSLQIQTIPYNTDLSLLEFISSDNSIATVDAKGVVHALKGKRGRITITVRSKESIAVSATQELQIISPFEYVKTVSYLEGHIEQN
ncbi:MAG: Ig-like domain-containing protein, partial [Flavobacterium sp.]